MKLLKHFPKQEKMQWIWNEMILDSLLEVENLFGKLTQEWKIILCFFPHFWLHNFETPVNLLFMFIYYFRLTEPFGAVILLH